MSKPRESFCYSVCYVEVDESLSNFPEKSWSGMATTIHSKIGMWYYYPLKGNHDGQHEKDAECWSAVRREIRENELAEWVLVDAVSKD